MTRIDRGLEVEGLDDFHFDRIDHETLWGEEEGESEQEETADLRQNFVSEKSGERKTGRSQVP